MVETGGEGEKLNDDDEQFGERGPRGDPGGTPRNLDLDSIDSIRRRGSVWWLMQGRVPMKWRKGCTHVVADFLKSYEGPGRSRVWTVDVAEA